MTKGLIGLAALLIMTGCGAAARVKATPLRDQSASQIEADRARCDKWAKRTAVVTVGYAACMIAAGYEATPDVRSTSQRVRLPRTPTTSDPTRVLIDLLDCDGLAQREAERGLGTIGKAIRDTVGWSWGGTADKRRQAFVACLKPRGYDISSVAVPAFWVAQDWQSRNVMKVLCAWCQTEGQPGYLGEREPFDNPAQTHGMCRDHRERLLELLPSKSFPDAELLIVVRPNDTALYEYLRRSFAGVPQVKVIVERRSHDRRRAQGSATDERRRVKTRRLRRGEVTSLGYTIVRFTPKVTTPSE